MNVTSIGDLAQNLMLRTRHAQLKSTISGLTQELSSGKTSDLSGRTGGDLSHLTDIEHNLTRLDAYSITTRDSAAFAQAAQLNLGRVQDTMGNVAATLATVGPENSVLDMAHASAQARDGLDDVINSLNGKLAGRSLFGGTATDRPPLLPGEILIASLRNALTGLTTTADIEQAAKDWFDDPAGFQTIVYAGSSEPLAPFEIGVGERVSIPLRAEDPVFRDALRQLATAAIADDPALNLDAATKGDLLQRSGVSLMNGQDAVIGIRADLGFAEARIEETATRNLAAASSLKYARNELLNVDPYETATRLQEVQFQLESLYSVTVRSARLSLLEYLR